jgi:uncharacterized protein YukE
MANDAGVKNIDELAQFGQSVKKLGDNMLSAMQQAQRRMNQVCEGWHDDSNDKFKAQFDESVRVVQKMSQQFTEYSQYIKKITDILNSYKNVR